MPSTDEPKLKAVTRVSWEALREPFRKVYSGVIDRIDINRQIRIYRVGKVTRIDIKDPDDSMWVIREQERKQL